jgi:hypothetical protein
MHFPSAEGAELLSPGCRLRNALGLEFELGAARPSKRNSDAVSLTESWFTRLLVFMKATIEIDDELYRRVKAAAALRGRKVKDLVAEGLRTVLRSSHTGLRTRRIKLPIVKSKKPGTLRLSNEMIDEAEARLDTGHES